MHVQTVLNLRIVMFSKSLRLVTHFFPGGIHKVLFIEYGYVYYLIVLNSCLWYLWDLPATCEKETMYLYGLNGFICKN